MTHSNDSRRPRRTRRQFTTAALVLLASVGWAQHVSAADPHSGGSAASGKIGAGPVTALAIDPHTPTTLYAGAGCSGVFKSVDGGDTWSPVNSGLTNEDVFALAINPTTPTTLYAGTRYGGVFRSLNGGMSWNEINTGLTDQRVTGLVIDPATATILYAGTYSSGVFLSLNGGSTWSAVDNGLSIPYVTALAIGATMPTTLYAGTEGGVFKSRDGGSSWEATLADRNITVLATGLAAPASVYAATYLGMFRSVNGGSSWQASGLTDQRLSAIAIDPATPTTLYAWAVWGGGVFKSVNGGDSWSEVNMGLPDHRDVNALAINPPMPATLYAGAASTFSREAGVFKSLNGGRTWEATGLGSVICGDGFAACGEQCDDGGETATCDADCTLVRCGDGTLNVTAGEQCDDGNRNPFDGCTNDCTVCADGVVTPPEECDGGTTSGGDGCDAQCRQPRVVGSGTPESCTEAEFDAALAERSVIFNCGPAPVTITLTSEQAISAATTIDGGGRITLSGGGVVRIFTVTSGAALDVRNLTIADGRGDAGGGIYNGGTLALTNCTLRGNSASDGGGIYNSGGTLTLANCTLSGNSATDAAGGAIYSGGTLTLTNCTLSNNSARFGGGGIANNYASCGPCPGCCACGSTIVTNSTLSGNSADVGAGGIDGWCPAAVTNSIIAQSSGANCGGDIIDGGHNLQFPGTRCGATIESMDPLLDPAGLQDNGGPMQTIALLPGSPAINAGAPEVCANPAVNGLDQRGYARPGTGHTQCSIGAYEADAVSLESCVGDCDGTGGVTIDEIITLVNIALGTTQAPACPHGVPSGAEVNVALIIQAVNVALNGCGVGPAEQGCLISGGTVTTAMCCTSTGDFPDTCAIGACGCAPDASHAVRVCECGGGSCFDGSGCVRQ